MIGLDRAVGEGSGFPGEPLLGLVEGDPADCGQFRDLLVRQEGELLEVGFDHGVFGIDPVLVVVVRREHVRIQPNADAGASLAHLLAGRRGDQRRNQGERLATIGLADQLDAAGDVGPLVRATHLQEAALGAEEVQEVVGLHEPVVELDEVQAIASSRVLYVSMASISLTEKCLPISRRNGM